MTLKWVKDIPARKTREATLPVRALDQRPGCWAILATYKSSKSASPTASRLRHQYGPRYEFAARVTGSGSALYGRRVKA